MDSSLRELILTKKISNHLSFPTVEPSALEDSE